MTNKSKKLLAFPKAICYQRYHRPECTYYTNRLNTQCSSTDISWSQYRYDIANRQTWIHLPCMFVWIQQGTIEVVMNHLAVQMLTIEIHNLLIRMHERDVACSHFGLELPPTFIKMQWQDRWQWLNYISHPNNLVLVKAEPWWSDIQNK